MKKIRFACAALALALLLGGCGLGLIYTHTMTPLTLDQHRTPLAQKEGTGDVKHLVLLYGPLSVAWGDAAIGEIAKKNQLQEVYFADLETLRILSIWNQYTLHVYGK
jgi:hypothetical protein